MSEVAVPTYTAGLRMHSLETDIGITSYYDIGHNSCKPAVLVPGFLCSALMYTDLAQELVKNGYRVIMYDPYGTGVSVKLGRATYNIQTMVEQLTNLVSTLNLKKIKLIGYSMGGEIATVYTNKFPTQVETLVLVSPGGVQVDLGPAPLMRKLRLPYFGPLYFNWFYDFLISGAVKVNFIHPEKQEMADIIQFLYLQIYSSWTNNPTFAQAAAGILRKFKFTGLEQEYKRLTVPTTVILAKNDICVTYEENYKFFSSCDRIHEVNTVDEAGHWGLWEKSAEMFPLILKALTVD